MMSSQKLLKCYCDHCANNTCTTNQLCYAEWKLTNYDQIVSHLLTTETPPGIDPGPLYPLIRLEKTFNCYGKDDPLLIRAICNQTASNTSHVIRRCCRSDYCNQLIDLLPNEQEAVEQIRRIFPTNLHRQERPSLLEQYSDLPLTLQIVIVLVMLSVLLYASVFVNQRGVSPKRPHQRKRRLAPTVLAEQDQYRPSGAPRARPPFPLDKPWSWVLDRYKRLRYISRDVYGESVSEPEDDSNRRPPFHEEEISCALPDHPGGFDTNSMASREPLIRPPHRVSPSDIGFNPEPSMQNDKDGKFFKLSMGTGFKNPEDEEMSSGSGQGLAYLTHRSVSHDIQLKSIIGRGLFGVVWKAEFKGEPVAVKIFGFNSEASWERETELYQTTMLRHKNILGLIAADRRHDTQTTGLWLVTDYYPLGSLYDFLYTNTITMWDATRMAYSIASGLAHLHVEIFGTRAKPGIAHRDIKSKNILVKNDGSCCIADLGMAARHYSTTGQVDVPTNCRVGTRRYLAPEILANQLNVMDFEAVKATDMYSYGLVLWEILRRTCMVTVDGSNNTFINRQATELVTSEEESVEEESEPGQFRRPADRWPPSTEQVFTRPGPDPFVIVRDRPLDVSKHFAVRTGEERERARSPTNSEDLMVRNVMSRFGFGVTDNPVTQMALGMRSKKGVSRKLKDFYRLALYRRPNVASKKVPAVKNESSGARPFVMPASLEFINREPENIDDLPGSPLAAMTSYSMIHQVKEDLKTVETKPMRDFLDDAYTTRVVRVPRPYHPIKRDGRPYPLRQNIPPYPEPRSRGFRKLERRGRVDLQDLERRVMSVLHEQLRPRPFKLPSIGLVQPEQEPRQSRNPVQESVDQQAGPSSLSSDTLGPPPTPGEHTAPDQFLARYGPLRQLSPSVTQDQGSGLRTSDESSQLQMPQTPRTPQLAQPEALPEQQVPSVAETEIQPPPSNLTAQPPSPLDEPWPTDSQLADSPLPPVREQQLQDDFDLHDIYAERNFPGGRIPPEGYVPPFEFQKRRTHRKRRLSSDSDDTVASGDTQLESVDSMSDEIRKFAFLVEPFEVPYQNEVKWNPDNTEMYILVCEKKTRPALSPRWLKFAAMRDYVTLMTECWYEKSQSRLSALRVRKSFSDLAAKHFRLNIQDYEA